MPHARRCSKEASRFGRSRSFSRICPPSPSPSLSTLRISLPISTSNRERLRDQGLQWVKGKMTPTHNGSYMCAGQNEGPGETTQEKSQTLFNSRHHLGIMSLGIKRTWIWSILFCLLFNNFFIAASATAGGGTYKKVWSFRKCTGIQTPRPLSSSPVMPWPSLNHPSSVRSSVRGLSR
jgi:hypothetical protein